MIISILSLILFLFVAAYNKAKGIIIAISAFVGVIVGDILASILFDEKVFTWWLYLLVIIFAVLLCFEVVRQTLFTKKIFQIFKKIAPKISATEQAAIDSGTVWWDGELFTGNPDYKKLLNYPTPKLTKEEQEFLDGPVEEICKSINDWEINHKYKDLSPETWKLIKESRIFGMIIKKEYGGLEFSQYAHAKAVMKIASRSGSAGTTVMVPNSLGPGELLQHYGTEEQKNYYLPRLANAEEIPCFALTSPYAGSDAGSIPDYGVVCKGDFKDPITGEEKKDIIGIKVTWEKRWITLAPIATVLGLAFKMYDPDGLLGGDRDIGITCALIPVKVKGVKIGRRHFPAGQSFHNGPTCGKDVFIPIDYIIGGLKQAGNGWRMLIECLSIGRCISLPATSCSGGKIALYTTSLYSVIRDQFKLSIGKFEGVSEAITRIAAYNYQMEAAQDLALTALDLGENPSVISAILKYNNTERFRKTVADAMDVHAGKTVVLGPRNYLFSAYQGVPVAITVEGANILTRTLMIFGQGAIRCHPYVLKLLKAKEDNNEKVFDKIIFEHTHFIFTNVVRSFVLSITNGAFSKAPISGPTAKYFKRINRLASNFAVLVDGSMFAFGGSLKFKEKVSGRLADVLSNLYIATAVLKRFENENSPKEDIPVLNFAAELALYDAEVAMDGLLRNMPNKFISFILRVIVFPFGRKFKYPSDNLGLKVSNLVMQNGPTLQRLVKGVHIPDDIKDPIGILKYAHDAVIKAIPLEKKIYQLTKTTNLSSFSPNDILKECLDKNLVTQDEYDIVHNARLLKRKVIMVDDFDFELKEHDEKLLDRNDFDYYKKS